MMKHGYFGAPGELAGNLDSVLHCFRTGVDEHSFLFETSRGVLGEKLSRTNVGLVAHQAKERVGDLSDLVAHGLDNGIVGVTHRGHTNSSGEVDELVAIDIDDDRVMSAVDVDGECFAHAL